MRWEVPVPRGVDGEIYEIVYNNKSLWPNTILSLNEKEWVSKYKNEVWYNRNLKRNSSSPIFVQRLIMPKKLAIEFYMRFSS